MCLHAAPVGKYDYWRAKSSDRKSEINHVIVDTCKCALCVCSNTLVHGEHIGTMQPGKALATALIIGSGLWLFGSPVLSALGISATAFLFLGGWKFIKQLKTFPRDIR